MTRRAIALDGIGTELELGRVTAVDLTDREAIYLEKMKDGRWRLTYTKSTIPDIQQLRALRVVRDDPPAHEYTCKHCRRDNLYRGHYRPCDARPSAFCEPDGADMWKWAPSTIALVEPGTGLRHRDGTPVCPDCLELFLDQMFSRCPKHTTPRAGIADMPWPEES